MKRLNFVALALGIWFFKVYVLNINLRMAISKIVYNRGDTNLTHLFTINIVR